MRIIDSLSDFHTLLSIPPPLHPSVSVVHVSELHAVNSDVWQKFSTNFYTISLKHNILSKVKYGQAYYDFDKGTMTFVAPKQVQSVEATETNSFNQATGTGYVLMFHPDFLYGHPLAIKIKNFGFFSYSVNEALHLSEKEEKSVTDIFRKIEEEYAHIDRHTQEIIISQIELLLSYSKRFYERQFITRKQASNHLLHRLEELLTDYFTENKASQNGLPTVTELAEQLKVSQRYLSDMARALTGLTTQQHIHEKLIEKAKEKLSTTDLSVSEIAYELGFEHSQSFSKFFKSKTHQSPIEFRQSFE